MKSFISSYKILFFLLVFILLAFILFVYSTGVAWGLFYGLTNDLISLKEFFTITISLFVLVVSLFLVLLKKHKRMSMIYLISIFAFFMLFSYQYRLTSFSVVASDMKLSQEILSLISEKKVDIYPTEIKIIKENKLNWAPRPNPFINQFNIESDGANSTFLQDDKNAPDFIFLNKLSKDDVMQQLNNEPQTFYQLLNNYKYIKDDAHFSLFSRVSKPQLPIKKTKPSENISFGTWVDVPDIENAIIQLKMLPQKTFLGRLLQVIGINNAILIEYKLYDGAIRENVLNEPLLDTIWVSPYFERTLMAEDAQKVKQIKLSANNKFLYEKTIPSLWLVIPQN